MIGIPYFPSNIFDICTADLIRVDNDYIYVGIFSFNDYKIDLHINDSPWP